ncbi:ATP-grasp domain-containing protein [Streptomyces sp. SP17BM10]|uniref:ATP-grasp domain-containing protein n=1 Tax=Streptomyces sp. SP17BM10 TaxID=3002530 RepID=UPI002E7855AC|nr:hypothetical protein [Streptomyces sp. SP17BM10]MEE1782938.1 ATP-grasp domain-containing protein [Streptomyces sp. SP17BM10]
MTARRENVLLLDRVGYDRYRLPDGSPVLDPDRYRVTLLTRTPLAGQARPGECAEVLGVRLSDAALRDALVRAVHQEVGLDHLLAFSENLLLPGARLREQTGVRGPSTARLLPFRDKSAMKRTAAGGGLPVCDWRPVERAADAAGLLDRHGRIVLKPRFGSGSAGIHVVDSRAALAALDGHALAGHQAEEFVDGGMLHVDVAVHRGELLTCVVFRYLTSTLSHVDNRPMLSVTVDDPQLVERATEFTRRVVKAFDVTDAVLHLELFELADGALVFNEVAVRNGGGGIVPVVQALTGVNLYEAMVRLALGERPSTGYPRTHRAAGEFIWYSRPGRLAAIDDEAIPRDWLISRRATAAPGDLLRASGFSGAGLVTYAVGGRDEAEVRARLEFIRTHTGITYADEPARHSSNPATVRTPSSSTDR